MHVEGMVNIRVCANNIQATLKVAISSELKENMLISCDDLRKLRVIPADFPNTVLAVTHDDLNPQPTKCTPMSIALEDNASPVSYTHLTLPTTPYV